MDFLTLSQINGLAGEAIQTAFPDAYWVMAETSDVRENKNGHCYLEFIEKRPSDNSILAKARGYIWSSVFHVLKPYFEMKTGQSFVSGLKVLVKVFVEFHPIYGYGLNVCDIDPAYTMGDLQWQRQLILDQLEEEGIASLNKELEMPLLPQRIAVITSPTAAGYEDFLDQLTNNPAGFVFYPHLFPAVMQGEQTEKSVIAALNAIYEHKDRFDGVVIIRGGGATSDLASFNTYSLAANCAQFPLPIITGIGHERDDTILDEVAFHRAKTPTAAADYFIHCMEKAHTELVACRSAISRGAQRMLEWTTLTFNTMARNLPLSFSKTIPGQQARLVIIETNLRNMRDRILFTERTKLKEKAEFFKLSSPNYILSRGYSITLKEGKTLKSPQSLRPGDTIETILYDGVISSSFIAPQN